MKLAQIYGYINGIGATLELPSPGLRIQRTNSQRSTQKTVGENIPVDKKKLVEDVKRALTNFRSNNTKIYKPK